MANRAPSQLRAALLAAAALSASSQAATLSWPGADGSWDTSTALWNSGALAWTDTSGLVDVASFGGTAGTVTLAGTTYARGLSFSLAGYTLAGGTLNLGVSGIDASTLSAGTTSVTSNLSLLGGAQTWNVGAGSTLALSGGAFTRAAGSTLRITNSGTVTSTMTGLAANTNGVVGPWALVGSGTSARFATFSGSSIIGFNTYPTTPTTASGQTTSFGWNSTYTESYNAEILGTTSSGTLGSGTNALGVSRVANTVRYTGGTYSAIWGNAATVTLTTNALLNVGTGTLTIGPGSTQGVLRGGSTGELILVAESGDIVVRSQITGSSSGAGNLTLSSASGRLITLSPRTGGTDTATNNTFTGVTTISGKVQANVSGAFGTAGTGSSSIVLTASPVASQLILGANGINIPRPLVIQGGGYSGEGALHYNLNSGTATWSGNITIQGNTAAGGHFGTLGNSGTLVLSGNVTSANHEVAVRAGAVTFSGAANSFSSLLLSQGVLRIGIANSLPTGSLLTLGNNTSSSTFDLSNFNQTLGGLTTSSTGARTVTNTGADLRTLTLDTSVDRSFLPNTGGLAGNLALTKTGSARQTLGGSNTHTGPTLVSAGTLALASGSTLANSAITVSSGATFDISAAAFALASGQNLTGSGSVTGNLAVAAGGLLSPGTLGAGTLSIDGNLTFAASGTLAIGSLAGYTASPALALTGNLALSGGAGAVTLSLPTGAIDNGTYRLISMANTLADVSGFTLSGGVPAGARQTASLQAAAGALNLLIDGNTIHWSGVAGDAAWNTTATNWTEVSSGGSAIGPTAFRSGAGADTALFDDRATVTTVTLDTAISPVATIFNNSAKDYVLSGAGAVATGTLAKSGAGKLTLNLENAFTSARLEGGTLAVGNNAALGAGTLTVTGGTLAARLLPRTLANAVSLQGDLALGAADEAADLTLSGAVNLAGGTRALAVASGVTATLTGAISNGGLSKSGDGTLVVTGVNTYAGGTSLAAGILRLGNNAALGAGTLTVSGGRLTANNATERNLANALALEGDLALGDATLNGNLAFSGAVNLGGANRTLALASNLYLSGVVSNGGITKTGAGALALSAANTYDGDTLLQGGITWLQHASGFGSTVGKTYLQGGAIYLLNTANVGTVAEAFEVTSASDLQSGNGSAFTLSGAWNLAARLTANNDAGSTVTLNGVISGTSGLTKTGGGATVLGGANTFAGGVVLSAGALRVGVDPTLDGATLLASALGTGGLVFNGGTLTSNGATARVVHNALSATGDISLGAAATQTGALAFTQALDLGGATRTLAANSAATFSAAVTNGSLTKAGGARLNLDGGATLAALTVNGGYVSFAAATSTVGLITVNTGSGNGIRLDRAGAVLDADLQLYGGGSVSFGVVAYGLASGAGTVTGDIAIDGSTQAGGWFASEAGGRLNVNGAITVANPLTQRPAARIGAVYFGGGGNYTHIDVNEGVIGLAADNGIAAGATLTFTRTNSRDNTFDLAGFDQSLASLVITGGGGTVRIGNSSTAADSTLTLTGTSAFAGILADVTGAGSRKLALAVAPGANVTLSGANTFSGGTSVDGTLTLGLASSLGAGPALVNVGGTLDLANLNPAALLVLNGGTLLRDATWVANRTAVGIGPTSASAEINAIASSVVAKVVAGLTANLAGVTRDVTFEGGAVTGLATFSGDLLLAGGTFNLASAVTTPGNLVLAGGTADFAGRAATEDLLYRAGAVVNGASWTGRAILDASGTVNLVDGQLGAATVVVGSGQVASIGLNFSNAIRLEGGALAGATLGNYAGTLTVAANQTLDIDGPGASLPIDNAAADIRLESGALLKGTGAVGDVVALSGSRLAPGNSPGTFTVASMTLQGGSGYLFEIENAANAIELSNPAVPGVDYDTVAVTGALDLSGLGTTPGNRFVLELISLADGVSQGPANFLYPNAPGVAYSFELFSFGSLVLGANASLGSDLTPLFLFDTDSLLDSDGNALLASGFSVTVDGGALVLSYAPIPEPSTYGLILGGLALAGAALRRRQKDRRVNG